MSWFRVEVFPAGADMSALSQYLRQLDIPHRFTDELREQTLWVPDASWAARARQALNMFALNPDVALFNPGKVEPASPKTLPTFAQTPINYLAIALCLLGYGLIFLPEKIVQGFTYLPAFSGRHTFAAAWQYWSQTGEYWRLLTPAFIHWNLPHILFNCLWLLELGKRLERYLGSGGYFFLLLILGVCGNLAQFLWAPQHSFGGISSALYGLLGFIAVMQRFDSAPELALPRSLINFMVAWIAVGFSGILDSVFGPMANGGHLGGLLLGVIAAGFYRWLLWPKRIDS